MNQMKADLVNAVRPVYINIKYCWLLTQSEQKGI